jgi:hypothetical protein
MGVCKCKFKFIRNVRRTGKVKAEIELTTRKEGSKSGGLESSA